MALVPPHRMLEGMRDRVLKSWSVPIVLTVLVSAPGIAAAATDCEDWHVEFLSVEGGVEIQRTGADVWEAANLGDRICPGDTVRVAAYGQATLALPDTSKLTLNHNSATTFESGGEDDGWLLRLLRGALHVISRDPRELRFSTPFANAGLEGTEFSIQTDDEQATVAVVEGEVVVTSPSGRVNVLAGELASATAGRPLLSIDVPNPLEYSRWAAYYPAILDADLPSAEQIPTAAENADPAFFNARAARRLSYGRFDTAEQDIARALSLAPDDTTAQALLAVLALNQGDRARAETLARDAMARDQSSAAPLLAFAQVQQSSGDFAGALQTLRRATAVAAANPLVWSHLAELELASGNLDASFAAATRALDLRSALAHAHAILGFASLARLDNPGATEEFARAIEADREWPLPRLGLGLALIKQGSVAEGREQFERAVILDPTNAVIRSYMAKAYDLENRGELTRTQLDIAKQIDPKDPTPWYYGSLYQAGINRPVAALGELDAAIALNDNQAVYRSRLGIDEDLAARAASLAQIYRDLGFEELALLHGSVALARNPADYSALRLLTSLYGKRPRHEIARVNAAFQSTLLQPLNLTPIQPRLAEANLFILDEAGPSDLTVGEFSPLLVEDGLRIRASAVSGEHGTTGKEVVLAGLHDQLSYNFGHFAFDSDGFRPNNDIEQEVNTAFVQYRPNYSTSIQAELRSASTESGDLFAFFDPTRYHAGLRQSESVDSLRLGVRHDLSERETLLTSISFQDIESIAENDPFILLSTTADGYTADLQHLHRGSRWMVTTGVMHFDQDRSDDHRQVLPIPTPPFTVDFSISENYRLKQTGAYSYAHFAASQKLVMTIGLSADVLQSRELDRDTLNPKLGVIWQPTPRTTIRGAVFGTLQGALSSSKQNIQPRLEPFQVAGFNQFFVDREGDEADVKGIGIDHQVSDHVFVGSEIMRRELDAGFQAEGSSSLNRVSLREELDRAYAYWALSNEVGLNAQLQRERIRDGGDAFLGMIDVRTLRVPLEARYFHRSGFRAALRASHIEQKGYFTDQQFGPGAIPVFQEDQFWIFDASLGYRLPNRRGMLSLHVDNLLDEDFRFQDTDALNPSIPPERMAYFRFTLAFD